MENKKRVKEMNVKHKLLRPAGELKKQAAAAAGQLAELVYPPDIYCISCGKAIPSGRLYSMCDGCLDTIHWANGKLCTACGKPLEDWYPDRYCSECIGQERSFDAGITCFQYKEQEREMIRNLKYHGKGFLARPLSEIMADRLNALPGRWDLVIPVPMYRKKERRRGYNQADLLARFMARRMGLAYSPKVLIRTRDTAPMNRLGAAERRRNLDHAFAVTEEGRSMIRGRRLLLVDDIFTTGTTAGRCAEVLKEAGSGPVTLLSLAAGRNQRELPQISAISETGGTLKEKNSL